MSFDHRPIEKKFSEIWQKERVYEPDLKTAAKPYYNLMMFPYPSAEGLHVGNMYAFTGADVHGRFRRMLGYDVFEPIGLDGFGIHSENYAIKVGRHPEEQAKISEENFYRQLRSIGNGFSWENRLETYDPQYYRWTQWLFIQMFKHGLAYKAEAMVNWCPKDKTVLADEQVEDGVCERCKTPVERRSMSSWFLKITAYADRLLDNIDNYAWKDADGREQQGLRWPAKVTTAQKNWIGRSEGLDIDFRIKSTSNSELRSDLPVENLKEIGSRSDLPDQTKGQIRSGSDPETVITVWTKFWETVFGVTYLVLAPEHPFSATIADEAHQAAVKTYIAQALNKSEQERQAGEKEKSGVFTGRFAVNPATGQSVPIWVADYVLTSVGTGAVMGVPSHDERDFAFARKFGLPVMQVVRYADPAIDAAVAAGERAFEGAGTLVNSAQFSGQDAWGAGKMAIKDWLIEQKFARTRTNYHLRDWLISRQRYWGPPIPLIYCPRCAAQKTGERPELPGWYSVTEDQLPVTLPHLDQFVPQGEGTSPLDNAPDDWKFVPCPECGGQAERETDVSDTFLDSSWYFLRYPSVHDASGPFPHLSDSLRPGHPGWFPVDAYIGGAEHAVLHLLYARFVTQALFDWNLVPGEEPFPFLFGHGLIIKDGAKMSKSKGNVVNPDDYIVKYGADALRSYLMFMGPYDQGGDFRDSGMNGMYKWLNRVWELFQKLDVKAETAPELKRQLNQVIAANTADCYQFKFNTCLARLMEVVNAWKSGQTMSLEEGLTFLKMLSPFAPFMSEELYQQLRTKRGESGFSSLHRLAWPQADQAFLAAETVRIAVQVSGKLRASFAAPADRAGDQAWLEEQAQALEPVRRHLTSAPKKVIVVPGKIVNFVL